MSKELKIFSEKAVALAMVLSYVHGSGATTKTDVDKNKVISRLTDKKAADFLAFLFMGHDLEKMIEYIADFKDVVTVKTYGEANASDKPNLENLKHMLSYYGDAAAVKTAVDTIITAANGLSNEDVNNIFTAAMKVNADVNKYITKLTDGSKTTKFAKNTSAEIAKPDDIVYTSILGAKVEPKASGPKASKGGALNQSGGFIDANIALLLRITLSLNIDGDRLYRERNVYGAVVSTIFDIASQIAKVNVPQYSNVSVSAIGNKLYAVEYDANTKTIKVTLNGVAVDGSIVEVKDGMYDKVGIKLSQPPTPGLLVECSRTKDASGCFKKLANLLDKDDKVVSDSDFNTVNPRLVIEMLETLRWPWKMSSNNGTAVRRYAESFAEFEEYHKKRSTPLQAIADADNKKAVVTFLQRCVQYINGSYPELINDATFMELKEKEKLMKDKLGSVKSIDYVATGYARDARPANLLANVFGPWSSNIVARNNSIARLQPGLHQILTPPMAPIMIGRGQLGGQLDGQYGGQLLMFYDNTIERLIQAMKVAGKKIDSGSEDRIRRSKDDFKRASEDFGKILSTIQAYKNVNTIMRDSKSEVSLEDMARYNERFQDSLNTLNKSEVKLAKIISKLQEAMIKTFNVNLTGDEMTV
jgi:chaperonin cofactor prefoldin